MARGELSSGQRASDSDGGKRGGAFGGLGKIYEYMAERWNFNLNDIIMDFSGSL